MKKSHIIILVLSIIVIVLSSILIYSYVMKDKKEENNINTINTESTKEDVKVVYPEKLYKEIPLETRLYDIIDDKELMKYVNSYIEKQKTKNKYTESTLIGALQEYVYIDPEDEITYNTYKILIENKKANTFIYELATVSQSDNSTKIEYPEVYTSNDIDIMYFYDKLHLITKKLEHNNKLVLLASENFCIECNAYGDLNPRIFIYNGKDYKYLNSIFYYNNETKLELSENKENVVVRSVFGEGGPMLYQYEYINVADESIREIKMNTWIGIDSNDKQFANYDISRCLNTDYVYPTTLSITKDEKEKISLIICNDKVNKNQELVIYNKQVVELNNTNAKEKIDEQFTNYLSVNLDESEYILEFSTGSIIVDIKNDRISKYER